MFKSQITAKSEEGIKLGLNKWHEYAQEHNHLIKKSQEASTAHTEGEEKSPQAEDAPLETPKVDVKNVKEPTLEKI